MGKFAWDLQCELSLLNNDGNLIDVFNFAALVALQRYKLPFVTVEGNKVKVWDVEEKQPQALSVHHWPISMTFGVMNHVGEDELSDYIMYDPSVS